MKRFYLSAFLAGLLGLILSMAAVSHIGVMSVFRQIEREPSETIKIASSLVSGKIESLPPEEVGAYLEEIERRVRSDVDLVPADGNGIDDGIRRDTERFGSAVRMTRSVFDHGVTLYVPVSIEGKKKIVTVGPIERPYSPDIQAYLEMALLVVTVLMLSSLLVSIPMLRRLKILEKTARRIADGQLEARVPIPADDGLVGFVAHQFNRMAGRIEQLMASRKMMLQAVSHELRTPTARIRFGLEMLEESSDPEERRRRLEAIDEDLTDLDELVEELLLFNKMDALGRNIDMAVTRVAPALARMVDKRAFITTSIQVELDIPDPDMVVMVDQRAFVRAIGNLVSNALKFARSKVQVIVRADSDSMRVSVCDDGPGVPPSERLAILEPFKRLDDSRNRESGGAGLGLAIVTSIVESHGGRIEVGDAEIGGARFTTWWPVP